MQYIMALIIVVTTVYANSFVMRDRVCANPLSMNSIVVACNDINFSNRADDYAVHLYELNDQLQTVAKTKLNIESGFVAKAIKKNEKELFLLAETHTKCIELFLVNMQHKQSDSILRYCDTESLSLDDEYYPQSILVDNRSLLFSMERESSSGTTVQLLYLQNEEQRTYQIITFPQYKEYLLVKMMPYKEGALVLLRSDSEPNNAVIMQLVKQHNGDLVKTVLYETDTVEISSFEVHHDDIFLFGNSGKKANLSLFVYKIDATKKLSKLLKKHPINFRPIELKVGVGLMLTGIFLNDNGRASHIGLVHVLPAKKAIVSSYKVDEYSYCAMPLPVEDSDYMSLFLKEKNMLVRIDPLRATIQQKVTLPVSHVLLIPNSPRLLHYAGKVFITYTAVKGREIKNSIQEIAND